MSNYICRVCLVNCEPETSSIFTRKISEMLQFCVPEFDLTLINNPIICGKCHISLQQLQEFRTKCIDVQNQILKLITTDQSNTSNSCISLNMLVNSQSPSYQRQQNANAKSFNESFNQFLQKDNDTVDTAKINQKRKRTNDDSSNKSIVKCIDSVSIPSNEVNLENESDTNNCKIKEEIVDLTDVIDSEEKDEVSISSNVGKTVGNVDDILTFVNESLKERKVEHNSEDELLDLLDSCPNLILPMPKPVEPNIIAVSSAIDQPYCNFYDDKPLNDIKRKEISVANNEQLTKGKSPKLRQNYVTKCPQCSQKFQTMAQIVTHLYAVHLDIGRCAGVWACLHCRYKCNHMNNLTRHYSKTHKGLRHFQASCIICPFYASTESHLMQHIKAKHLNIFKMNTYHCNSCNFKCDCYETFKTHYLNSHDDICNFCLLKFSSTTSLNIHMSRHYVEKCDIKKELKTPM